MDLKVPSNTTYYPFTIPTVACASAVNATLTAIFLQTTKTAPLTVQPATVTALTVSPTTINYSRGSRLEMKLTISAPAGPNGVRVVLSSSNPSVINPGASILVPIRSTSVDFGTNAGSVGKTTVVTLTATLGGVSKTVTVTVNP